MFLRVALTDGSGTVKVLEDRPVSITVDGPGRLAALGSANPYTPEGFRGSTHSPHLGRALAVVRAERQAGTIDMQVSAPGCEAVHRSVKVRSVEQ